MSWLNIFFGKTKNKRKYSKVFNPKFLKLNVQKDIEDKRDWHILSGTAQLIDSPPFAVSLKPYCTDIKNQGRTGACVSFALTGAFELLRKMHWDEEIDTSELFTYYNSRLLQGWEGRDSGSYGRDAIKSAVSDGIALEAQWPFQAEKVLVKPPILAYFGARLLRLRVNAYYRCNNIADIKQALFNGMPVIFGMVIKKNFYDYEGGIYSVAEGKEMGGHYMCCIGYNDEKQAFEIRNSWGTGFGAYGYAWIKYDVLIDSLIDAWALNAKRVL